MYNSVVILAAGKGKRMKSDIPKVLHKLCGKEMINHVIDAVKQAGIDDINVVIGNKAEQVKKATEDRNVKYSYQNEQLGTGHAVMCCEEFLKNKKGTVAIFTGDAPLIKPETIKKLIKYHEANNFDATILTTIFEDPQQYGRVIRDENGQVCKIVEFKDCSERELNVHEINSGMYCFDIEGLVSCLKLLNNNNNQGEYYLTDVISIMNKQGKKVGALEACNEDVMGINSRVQLAQASQIMRKRINEFHMENGVTIIDPNSTYIDCDVVIGRDTIIYPGNVIEGKTRIGKRCTLYHNSRIKDSVIGDNVTIESSVILESKIMKNTTVGPFAYIRPQSIIGESVRIGDFVEIKKSTIGNNTKVSHLTYIGDAEVGSRCNFGCGTVVVNYDGTNKHKTIIGDHVFIGCNSNLVSPVIINDNSYIAAGSTIIQEVPDGALAIARARQVNKENWVAKKGLWK